MQLQSITKCADIVTTKNAKEKKNLAFISIKFK